MLRRIEAQEHKLHAQKLQRAAEKREAEEEEMALQHLEVQKVQLLKTLAKWEKAIEVEGAKQIKAGDEPSAVDIMMDTSGLDYSIIEEQGQFPKALSDREEKAYNHLVTVKMNQIQWKYEVLTYLSLLIEGNKCTQLEEEET